MAREYWKILNGCRKGEIPPPISVAQGLIIEGHHRFVAGVLFGQLPEMVAGSAPRSIKSLLWSEVKVENFWWRF